VKLLITHFRLAEKTSSELFVRDLARLLADGGNEVAVFSTRTGPVADALREEGIEVVDHPRKCPFRPELIHGQGNLETMATVLSFPGVPAAFASFGSLNWRERPPVHPRIFRYLGVSRPAAQRLREDLRNSEARVETIPNYVDIGGFGDVGRVSDRPETALFYDWFRSGSKDWKLVEEACRELDIRLDRLSDQVGKAPTRPEVLLPNYDLVFTSGRFVVEALAAGCGVIPVSGGSFGELVTTENFYGMVASDFTERRPPAPDSILAADLVTEIETWDWRLLTPLAAKVREVFGRDAVRSRFAEIYDAILEESRGKKSNARHELPAIANWLLEMGEQHDQLEGGYREVQHRAFSLQSDRTRAASETEDLLSRLETEKEKVRLARQILQDGNVLHQRLKRRIEEGWREIEASRDEANGASWRPFQEESAVDLSG